MVIISDRPTWDFLFRIFVFLCCICLRKHKVLNRFVKPSIKQNSVMILFSSIFIVLFVSFVLAHSTLKCNTTLLGIHPRPVCFNPLFLYFSFYASVPYATTFLLFVSSKYTDKLSHCSPLSDTFFLHPA